MLLESLLLPGVIAPAAAGAAVWLGALFLGRRQAGGLALAAAFLAAYVAANGWPRWPPVEATQRLFFLTALAALLSLLSFLWKRAPTRWATAGFLFGPALALLLHTPLRHRWSAVQAVLWLGPLFLAALAAHRGYEVYLEGGTGTGFRNRLLTAAPPILLTGGAAVVLGLSESALLAQLAGALVCGMAVVEILAALTKRRPWAPPDALVWATPFLGLLLIGHFYAALRPWPALLLLAAALLLALRRPAAPLWHSLLPLLPLATALALVLADAAAHPDDPYAGYGDYGAASE